MRILSRDECFSQNSKKAHLKDLFPNGDHAVCTKFMVFKEKLLSSSFITLTNNVRTIIIPVRIMSKVSLLLFFRKLGLYY